jgi:hypothetical protein
MSGNFDGRRILVLVLFMIASCSSVYGQVPCPVTLVSARAEKDSIQLEFMNKGKVPIEQLDLSCSPSGNNTFPNGICHAEHGIFYPGMVSWIKIDYLGANRHRIDVSVEDIHLAGGILWQPRTSDSCKVLRVPHKN